MSGFNCRFIVIALWLLSLVAVGTLAHAQEFQNPPLGAAPGVFSGADIGFQASETDGKVVIGKLVVRVNGQWREAQFAPGMRVQPLTAK